MNILSIYIIKICLVLLVLFIVTEFEFFLNSSFLNSYNLLIPAGIITLIIFYRKKKFKSSLFVVALLGVFVLATIVLMKLQTKAFAKKIMEQGEIHVGVIQNIDLQTDSMTIKFIKKGEQILLFESIPTESLNNFSDTVDILYIPDQKDISIITLRSL